MNIKHTLIYKYWRGMLEAQPEKFATTIRDVITINKGRSNSEFSKALEELLRLVLKYEKEAYNSKISDCLYLLRIHADRDKITDAVRVLAETEQRLSFVNELLEKYNEH